MDIFNTKKIAALEARIAALEPKSPSYQYYATGEEKPTLGSLNERLKAVEEEVIGQRPSEPYSLFTMFRDLEPEKLTLRRKVERLMAHLKIQFVTEPQRTVIKPVKAERSTR